MRKKRTGFAAAKLIWLVAVGGLVSGGVSPASAGRHFHGGVRLAASESSYMALVDEGTSLRCSDKEVSCYSGTGEQGEAAGYNIRTASAWCIMWVVARVYPSVCQDVPTRMLGVCSKEVRDAEMQRRGLSLYQRSRL